MKVDLENVSSQDCFVVGPHPLFPLGEPPRIPPDILKDMKTLQEVATLSNEALVHLKDLKNLIAVSEINERKINFQQVEIEAKEKEILKAVLEISMVRRELCGSEINEDCTNLDREMAEMGNVSSTPGKVSANMKFSFSSSGQTKNLDVGDVVAERIKCISALETGEVPMDIVEECPPSGSTAGMCSSGGTPVLPERLNKIQSEELKLVEEETKAAKEIEVALEEQRRFTSRHLNNLARFKEMLVGSVSKVNAALVDLSKECEDPDLINLIVENQLLKELQMKVINEVMKLAEMEGKIKTKRIELNYHRNLFEPRLKLLMALAVDQLSRK